MDAIEATTRTETRQRLGGEPGGRGGLVPLLVAALLGLGLLSAGTMHLVSGLYRLKAADTLAAARGARPEASPRPDALAVGAALLARANGWVAQGTVESDRGFLLLQQAETLPQGPERQAVLTTAEAATRAALVAAPAQPAAWARLAYLRAQAGDVAEAARAMRLSILSGPVTPAMQSSRLGLGLALMDAREATGLEDLLARQTRLAWLVDPFSVVPLASDPRLGAFVRDALANLTPAEQALYARRQTPSSFVPR